MSAPSTFAADSSKAATSQDERLPLLERLVDLMNPILVKEVRQAFKGRAFVFAFALLIFCCWMISVIGALRAGSSLEYFSWAPQFFSSYFVPLSFAIGVIVPFMAYNSMLSERTDDTFDMLCITTLRSRKIVNGKLANAFVQVMLMYATFTPFVAFTSLLQGFRVVPVALALGIALFSSMTLCAVSIYVSTLARTRFVQVLISLVLIVGLLLCLSSVQLLFAPGFWNIPWQWEVGLAFGLFALGAVGIILLLREYSVAAITFEADNRATGIRVVTSVIVVVGWLIVSLYPILYRGPGTLAVLNYVGVMTVMTCILVGFVAFGACTEPPQMSRRVRIQVGRFPLWAARLFAPWLPGCSRGFLFALLHVAPFGWLTYYFWVQLWSSAPGAGVPYRNEVLLFASVAAVLYVVFFSGVAGLVSQAMHRSFPGSRTVAVRAACLIVIALLVIIPPIIVLVQEEFIRDRIDWAPWMITCPFMVFSYLLDFTLTSSAASWQVIYVLMVPTVLVAIANFHGIYGSFVELIRGRNLQNQTDSQPGSSSS